MRTAGHDLKDQQAFHDYLDVQWAEPDEEFVRFLTEKVYVGRITDEVHQQFEDIVRVALRAFVREKIQERLSTALADDAGDADAPEPETADAPATLPSLHLENDDLPTAAWDRA